MSVPHAGWRCPACGGMLRPWRDVPASDPAWPGTFSLRRCTACGTAVTGPAGDEHAQARARHERGAYATASPRGLRALEPVLRGLDRRRLSLLRTSGRYPPAVLDVGAGRGRFVAVARAAGLAAEGIEPSRRGVEAARARYGVELMAHPAEEVQLPGRTWPAVTLWHVLEHVADPAALLARIREWTAPGAMLLVGVPNLSSLQARLGGARWFHLDVPRHRTHFTARGLRLLLDAQGWDVSREHHVLLEHNPFGMWQSLVSRAGRQPGYLFQLLKRNAPVRSRDLAVSLAALPLAPAAAALELGAGLAGRGGTIAVLARRRD